MITLHSKNLEFLGPKDGLSLNEIAQDAKFIADYIEKIEAREQKFYTVIDDIEPVSAIEAYAAKVSGKFSDIVVAGIGGSALGTLCLQQSLTHLFENEKTKREFPRLHVVDNVDPVLIKELEDVIDYSKTLFIVVTKSGSTPETLAQYFYFRKRVEEQKLDPQTHFVFVTDATKGQLREIANTEKITSFEVPDNVGGRFSVLTPVGLLPAKLIGIDIRKLLEGAKSMRDQFLNTNFEQNTPFQLASIQYLMGTKGKTIQVLIPYSQKLIRFADWYRQLLAESIGKALNDRGETVNVGLTPINALGVTDQHSQAQLYNEGPNDKLFMFIGVNDFGIDMAVDFLGASFGKLMHVEMQGLIESLTSNLRPNITLQIEKVDAWHLGALIMLFEGATAYLGEMYGINAFNQPGVELSKQITKKLLLQKN